MTDSRIDLLITLCKLGLITGSELGVVYTEIMVARMERELYEHKERITEHSGIRSQLRAAEEEEKRSKS